LFLIVNCQNNQLKTLPKINRKLKLLVCENNPFLFLNDTDSIDTIRIKLRIISKFRYLYHSLKFKKKLRDWLWIYVREPKIREKFRPENLAKLLELHGDGEDLDEAIRKWTEE